MSKRTATLKVENCLDCPHSKEIQDSLSGDSFDWRDVSLCCTKTPLSPPQKTDRGEVVPGRRIVAYERVIRRTETQVPDWCPLLDKASVPTSPPKPKAKCCVCEKEFEPRDTSVATQIYCSTSCAWPSKKRSTEAVRREAEALRKALALNTKKNPS